jgi:hypothetical protein
MPIVRRDGYSLPAVIVAVSLAGCGGSPSSPSASSAASLAGSWTGTAVVNRFFLQTANSGTASYPTATLTLVIPSRDAEITAAGVQLSGTWTMTFVNPAATAKSGTLTAHARTDCDAAFGYIVIGCHNTYEGTRIKDLVLTSGAACSTLKDSWSGSHDVNANSISDVFLSGGRNDPTCGVAHEEFEGQFTLTKH